MILDQTGSTNAHLAERVRRGETASAWCLTHRQTAGRGRRGRGWQASEGDFLASVVVWPDLPLAALPQVSFAAGLAVREVLTDQTGAKNLRLKWPNDVLAGQKKICGILLETCTAQGRTGVIAGIGINLQNAPQLDEPGDYPPSSLREETGCTLRPETVLDALAPVFARELASLEADGFRALRERWLSAVAGIGEPLVARLPDREERGVFEGLDEDGALLLKTDQGTMVISAADVYQEPKKARDG